MASEPPWRACWPALEPRLAIEIGTAEGGSLRCLARHCAEIHSFDLVQPVDLGDCRVGDVTLHTGDSHELLPFLGGSGRGRRTTWTSCSSTATTPPRACAATWRICSPRRLGPTVIVMHDTTNERVREGLDASLHVHPSVAHVDLDFVAGHLSGTGAYAGQLWGGLGLVMVDTVPAPSAPASRRASSTAGELLRAARDLGRAAA